MNERRHSIGAAVCAVLGACGVAHGQPSPSSADGRLAGGAAWTADTPARWNGVLLLWSRGYAPEVPPATDAPPALKAWLLERGYALAGSNYGASGWALEEAVPAQIATIDAFTQRFGRPRKVIAWGFSMGGLTSLALVEQHPDRIDAALPFCGSVGGALGMMNTALNGAVAFRTLQAPDSGLELVNVKDDRANAKRVAEAVARAQETPQGRARLALAAALAGLPPWSDPRDPEPASTDYRAQEIQAAKAFPGGVFLPRADQERRAGGVFSWTTGVDFRAQFDASGRRAAVEALYAEADLDLNADLDRLAVAPRIAADPRAVAYMRAHYTPSGRLVRSVLSLHTTADGMTVPANESAYAETVRTAGRASWLRLGWVHRAGHCTFTPAEQVAALTTLKARLDDGHWSATAADLSRRAVESGLGAADFTTFDPPRFARPCAGASNRCAGEPLATGQEHPQ